jgi:hypothetical protein
MVMETVNAATPNLDINHTGQNNIIVKLRPEHIASKAITDANLAQLLETVGEALSELKHNRSHVDSVGGGNTPQLHVIFDASDIRSSDLKHGDITNLGALMSRTNLHLSRRSRGDNVELISRNVAINEAMRVSGMDTIVRVTNPDEPTIQTGGGMRR